MSLYYSAVTGGIYDDRIHGKSIPDGSVAISTETRASLMNGQANGKMIVADGSGAPVLIDPTTSVTYDERLAQWRTMAELSAVQLRLALRSRSDIAEMSTLAALFPSAGNLLDLVQRYVATLADDDEARVIWEYATRFVRGDEGIATLFSTAVGVDDDWIGDLYDQVLGTKPAA